MKRSIFGAVALAAVAFTVVLIGTASAAKPPPATANGCPNGGTYLVDPNVGADFTGTTTRTYTFSSWVDQNPVNGVPGLVGYCVITNQTPTTVTASYDSWKASKANQTFSFTRPNGEKTNIPLDGTTNITVGSATFTTAPTSQTILLHVSDAATCQALYGGTATTCFVLPGPKPGPYCDTITGNSDAGYNVIPDQVENCGPPSYAFEGNFANEFGDKVTLDTTASGGSLKVQSMRVDFQSYGCSDSGNWYGGGTLGSPEPCVTTPGTTFTIPGGITASIYDPSDLTTPIATSTINPSIPYRPSADSGNCAGTGTVVPQGPNDTTGQMRWFDTVSQTCKYSRSVPLTFTFAGQTLPASVVWTVQFDTSHAGYQPIVSTLGSQACNATAQGCGYDALNVGTKNYPGAPYVGSDDDNAVVYKSTGNSVYAPPLIPLAASAGWTDGSPLGEIVLG
jgi:hypothetical protein